MYGSCKVHKASVGDCPPFRPILSALNTPNYKLAKFLVPTLKPLATNELFKESETVEGLSKTEFKELLSLATKDSHFIFDETLYKQIGGVAMGYLLDPAFLVYHEKD